MKLHRKLCDGSIIMTAKVEIVITRSDLKAVTCYALSQHGKSKQKHQITRDRITTLLCSILENSGISGFAHCQEQYDKFGPRADLLVSKLFPESVLNTASSN